MALFKKEDKVEESVMELEPKDGKKHVFLVNMSIKNLRNPEKEYNLTINRILQKIQSEGYDILDVKIEFCSWSDTAVSFHGLPYSTLIIYK